jgi:hypothetical protein
MAESVAPGDIDAVLTDAAWAIRSTYHTVLKASLGAAIFGRDMMFDIPFIADWKKIGDYRQHQSDLNNWRKNQKRIEYDYKVGDKILVRKRVYSAKLSPSGIKIHGPLSQFIQMEQSGFNAETS